MDKMMNGNNVKAEDDVRKKMDKLVAGSSMLKYRPGSSKTGIPIVMDTSGSMSPMYCLGKSLN